MLPYRLVAHLALALTLYASIIWTGLSVLRPVRRELPTPAGVRLLANGCLALVGLTIVAGGFVAGLHAGYTYNTFPLMDGGLVPAGYASLDPLLRNMTENVAAVQFNHRVLATLSLGMVTLLAACATRAGLPGGLAACLAVAVGCQYLLGVATLLFVVPTPLAVLHQLGAVMLLTMLLIVAHRLARWPDAVSKTAAYAAPRR